MIKTTLFINNASRGAVVFSLSIAISLCGLSLNAAGFGQAKPQETAASAPIAHFHHLHLNVTDPAAAISFYTSKFDCEKGRFAGVMDGVWAQKSWLLFNKVSSPPPWEPTS